MKMLSKTLMMLSIALGLAACGPDGGKMNDAGAAGGPDAGATTGPAAFLGGWRYEAGTSRTSFVCSDGTNFDIVADGTGTEMFTAGTAANEVVATNDSGCPVTCTVSGNTATCWSGETCAGVTVTTDVFTLVGGELHEVASGSVTLDDGTLCQFASPAGVLAHDQ